MSRFYGKYARFTDVLSVLTPVPAGFTPWQELEGYLPGEACGLFLSSAVAETGEVAVVYCPCDICARTPWVLIITEEGMDSYILNSYASAHEAFQGAQDARKIAAMIDAPGITDRRRGDDGYKITVE